MNVYGVDVQFYVVSALSHDALLGDDALWALRTNISYNDNVVKLAGKKHQSGVAGLGDLHLASVHLEIDKWVTEFPELFDETCQLTKTDSLEIEVDTGYERPFHLKAYRMPLRKRQLVDEQLEKMLEDDIIEPSESPWASPITLVPKPGGGVRFCCDFRRLNSITKRNSYPLPSIDDIFDSMTGAKVFSTLDLRSGYWQIPMAEGSKEKSVFICHRGLYQFKRLPFGLTNGPAKFQRFMNKILAPYMGVFCCCYLDDIVVFSKTEDEHDLHLRKIFEVLREHNLKLKPSKCHLKLREIKLLGYIISDKGKRSDPEKIEALANMAQPCTTRQVRSFLGLSGYYRSLVPNYAKIAAPLTKLLKKHVRFKWGKDQELAWQTLRDELISDRVMAYPQPDKPYKLYTDACEYAVGAILVQDDEQGIDRPIQYVSKQLQGSQLSWPVIEKEGFGVMFAIKKLAPYLHGAEFTIYTDHKPLKSLFVNKKRNLKVQRWSIALAEMGAKIKYREGRNNVRADALSRIKPAQAEEPVLDNPYTPLTEDDEILQTYLDIGGMVVSDHRALQLEDSCQRQVSEILKEGDPGIPWDFNELEQNEIIQEQKEMPEYIQGIQQQNDYVIDQGLLYTLKPPPGKTAFARLVLQPSARFRVIRRAHQEVGHQGMRKTMERLQEHCKWPGQRKDVWNVLHKCARCQVHSGQRKRPPPTYMPVARYPCQIVGMDLTGPFVPSEEGNQYVLTIIDHCTGWAEAKPIPSKSAKHVLRYLEQEYVPRYGAPEVVICDNGLELKNNKVVPYLEALGSEIRHSSPYHPETNSKIERFHRTIKEIIRKLVNAKAGEWERCLGPALWAHRVSHSVVTGYTPYFLTYGRHPITPKQKLLSCAIGSSESILAERLDTLSSAFQEAARRTEESRHSNMQRPQRRATAGDLSLGDHVCVLAQGRTSMDPKWDHGFIVTRIRGPVVTVVGPRNSRRAVNRVHVRLVDPGADWEELNPRVSVHQQRRDKLRNLWQGNTKTVPSTATIPGFGWNKQGARPGSLEDRNDPDYEPPLFRIDHAPAPVTRSQGLKRTRPSEDPVSGIPAKRSMISNKRPISEVVELDTPEPKRYKGSMVLRSHRPSSSEQENMQMDAVALVYDFLHECWFWCRYDL